MREETVDEPIPSSMDKVRGWFGGLWAGLKQTYNEFSEDDVMTQAAALAFYSGLSIAPLLTISVWIAQYVFGDDAKTKIANAFAQVIGPQAAAPIKELLDPASQQANQSMTISGLISIGLVLFAATTVFAQLQFALNQIWGVKMEPQKTSTSIWIYVRKRLLSFGMLLSLLFLLLVSLVVSTVLQAVSGMAGASDGVVWAIINQVVSFGLFTVLFAAMFRYLPDVQLGWKDVWIGSLISAALFVVGKWGLGIYLGRSDYNGAYGAAIGSFVALLVWVYYSATILLIGAEATQVYARRHGKGMDPEEHAVRIEREEREVATAR